MKVSKYINPNIIQDGSIEGDKKIKDYPPLKKGTRDNSVQQDSCTASGSYSHAEGYNTTASGWNSHAEGAVTKALGLRSHAEGWYTTAKGDYSHAEGESTIASGVNSHAEGYNTTASGRNSHVEGAETKALGLQSHAEGYHTIAKSEATHSEGSGTTASGSFSHAEGNGTTASGSVSHAEGDSSVASGSASHTEGTLTIAQNANEHAEGRANVSIKDKTIHTVGIGASNADRRNAEEIHSDGKRYVYGIGGYDGTNSQAEGIKTVQEVVAESANAVKITYAELKSLRDAGKLVTGAQYRITDYTCTTTETGTKSAEHVFDIIVTADDESTLNEVARAVKHEGDTYFANSDLNAWKIWYCLDNDTTRFAWADATNGKGVIYRMIDEFNNDIPYDFKNIQFRHPNDTTTYPYYYYTFASSNLEANTDYSLSITNKCYSNTIREYISGGKRTLNRIIFIGVNCYSNFFGFGCYNNSFGDSCYSNSFGNSCYFNSFGNDCYSNSFGIYCYYIKFASDGSAFTKYNYYRNNHFGDGCKYIVFKGAETASYSSQVQNYNFAQGLQGTSSAYLTIDGVRGRTYETKVAKKSNGEVKIYCEADLIL